MIKYTGGVIIVVLNHTDDHTLTRPTNFYCIYVYVVYAKNIGMIDGLVLVGMQAVLPDHFVCPGIAHQMGKHEYIFEGGDHNSASYFC